MLEISELKAKKLPELQDIAKNLNVPKYRTLKKLDLVYQILDHQAANPNKVKTAVAGNPDVAEEAKANKPKPSRQKRPRARKPEANVASATKEAAKVTKEQKKHEKQKGEKNFFDSKSFET